MIQGNQEAILSMGTNKQQLVDMISEELRNVGFTVLQ